MSGELVRWDAEADVLAAVWVDGVGGRLVQHARVERRGDRSSVCARIGDQQWATEVPASLWRVDEAATLRITEDAEWWRQVDSHPLEPARVAGADERRRHEAAAAAALWTAKPRESLVADRVVVDFTLACKGADTVVSFIDGWAGQRELIEFPVWLEHHGGVDAEALGNFWLGLAEGIVRGTPVP